MSEHVEMIEKHAQASDRPLVVKDADKSKAICVDELLVPMNDVVSSKKFDDKNTVSHEDHVALLEAMLKQAREIQNTFLQRRGMQVTSRDRSTPQSFVSDSGVADDHVLPKADSSTPELVHVTQPLEEQTATTTIVQSDDETVSTLSTAAVDNNGHDFRPISETSPDIFIARDNELASEQHKSKIIIHFGHVSTPQSFVSDSGVADDHVLPKADSSTPELVHVTQPLEEQTATTTIVQSDDETVSTLSTAAVDNNGHDFRPISETSPDIFIARDNELASEQHKSKIIIHFGHVSTPQSFVSDSGVVDDHVLPKADSSTPELVHVAQPLEEQTATTTIVQSDDETVSNLSTAAVDNNGHDFHLISETNPAPLLCSNKFGSLSTSLSVTNNHFEQPHTSASSTLLDLNNDLSAEVQLSLHYSSARILRIEQLLNMEQELTAARVPSAEVSFASELVPATGSPLPNNLSLNHHFHIFDLFNPKIHELQEIRHEKQLLLTKCARIL